MSAPTLEVHSPRVVWQTWREHGFALGAAVALHLGLAMVLFNLSHNAPLKPAVSAVLTAQLVTLPAPVVQPPPLAVAPTPAPAPEPVVEASSVEQADLAFKRVQQERREQARKAERDIKRRREQVQRQEQLARDEQKRQAQVQEQQLAEARQADAERQAAASRAAPAQVDDGAASRQYLPIAKQAPDYPQRALDRKIEGECTVAYRVNAQGRVEDPQVVGSCHPLFVKPSLAAAKTFRYQPKVVNGKAVAVASVKNTFSYRIQ